MARVHVVERPGAYCGARHSWRSSANPGPKAVFGPIQIEGVASVDENVIRRELAFFEGDCTAQPHHGKPARIYALELFQFVNITPRLSETFAAGAGRRDGPEGKHRPLQLSGIRIRGTGAGDHQLAPRELRRRRADSVDDRGQVVVAGAGHSRQLHRALSVPAGTVVRLSGLTWWSNEPVYESQSKGGRAIFSKDFSRVAVGADRGARNQASMSIIHEYRQLRRLLKRRSTIRRSATS